MTHKQRFMLWSIKGMTVPYTQRGNPGPGPRLGERTGRTSFSGSQMWGAQQWDLTSHSGKGSHHPSICLERRTPRQSYLQTKVFSMIYHISDWCKWHFEMRNITIFTLTGGKKLIFIFDTHLSACCLCQTKIHSHSEIVSELEPNCFKCPSFYEQ